MFVNLRGSSISSLLTRFRHDRSRPGGPRRRRLSCERLEDRQLLALAPAGLGTGIRGEGEPGGPMAPALFDFNGFGSPSQPGYTGVLPTDVYGPTVRSYGWDSPLVSSGFSYQGAFDRGSPPDTTPFADLRRDGHWSIGPHTFRVDVPNGTYWVNVTVGDAQYSRDRIRVLAEGTAGTDDLTVEAGQWVHAGFSVAVADGRLDLLITDPGLDPYWVWNGLEVRPLMSVAPVTFASSLGSLPADGMTVDTISGTAPAGSLLTLTSTFGTILTDASAEYLGHQALTNDAGVFTFRLRRPISVSTPTFTATAVDGSARGASNAVLTYVFNPTGLWFDLNGPGSPTQPGYLGVLPTDTFVPVKHPYGWDAPLVSSGFSYQGSFDRGTPPEASVAGDLRRDGHWSDGLHTFRVEVPNGDYSVNVTVGDAAYSRDRVWVLAEEQVSSGDLSTSAGQWAHAVLKVSVDDGELDLQIADAGGDPYWVLNGVEVRPVAAVAPVTFTSLLGSLAADGSTVDTITGTAPAGTRLTVTSTLGTILTDASPAYVGTQVLTDSAGVFKFRLLRPAGAGTPAFTATAVNGAAVGASDTAVMYLFDPAGLSFDFNGPGSPTQPGYLGVLPTDVYVPVTHPYGWDTALVSSGFASQGAFDRALPPATAPFGSVRRDGHWSGGSHTFRLDVPDGTYWVSVTVGDGQYDRDRIRVLAEGTVSTDDLTTQAGEWVQAGIRVPVDDGRLDLQVSDAGGDPYWVLNGLDVRPVAAVAPVTFTTSLGLQPADGMTVDTIFGTAPPGALLTLTSTLGTILTDASPAYAGTQAQANAAGVFEFEILRPLVTGTPVFTAAAVDGSAQGTSSAVVTYTMATVSPTPEAEMDSYTNRLNPTDVNADGRVTPLDVLIPIDRLNAEGSHPLTTGKGAAPYVDVNADGRLTAMDPLVVINAINSGGPQSGAAAEGEASSSAATEAETVFATPLPSASLALAPAHREPAASTSPPDSRDLIERPSSGAKHVVAGRGDLGQHPAERWAAAVDSARSTVADWPTTQRSSRSADLPAFSDQAVDQLELVPESDQLLDDLATDMDAAQLHEQAADALFSWSVADLTA